MRSVSLPFRFENGSVAETSDNPTIAKQRIIDVLATRGYERVMRPGYGAGISDLLFEPMDPLVFADYKLDAVNAINESVTNAYVRDLLIREGDTVQYNGEGESTLVVRVVYDVANAGTATFTVSVNQDRIITEETEF
jgi:phage baseplate assembly protein W